MADGKAAVCHKLTGSACISLCANNTAQYGQFLALKLKAKKDLMYWFGLKSSSFKPLARACMHASAVNPATRVLD